MSDSTSEEAAAGEAGFPAVKSHESISTENDTEADIEEMPSIAEYEEVAPPSADGTPAASKDAPVAAAKEAPASAKDTDKKEEPAPAEQPVNETIEPKAPPKPTEPLKPVEVEEKKSEKPAPEDKEKSLSEKAEKSQKSEAEDMQSGDKTPINTPRSTTKSTSSSKGTSEKSEKDKKIEDDVSEKTLTPSHKSHSKSKKASSRSQPSSDSKRDVKSKSSGNSDRNRSVGTKASRVSKKSSQQQLSRDSRLTPSSTPRTPSKRDMTQSSVKDPSPRRKMSSSYTTFARAETTPSWHTEEKPDDFQIKSNSSLCDSSSITSGLQSLRDIFFDDADSHRGYLQSYSYWSHKDREDDVEKMSIPSYNSHVQIQPIYLPDIDQNTFVKDQLSTVPEKSFTQSNEVKQSFLSTENKDKQQQTDDNDQDYNSHPKGRYDMGVQSPISRYEVPDYDSEVPVKNKKVDFVAGSDVESISLEHSVEDHMIQHLTGQITDDDQLSIASENIVRNIDRKYISFTPNTLLCDLSNIIPNHQNLVKVEGRHILNKEVCLEFMCWLENLNDMFMSKSYGAALDVFQRQESRFKIVLYECLKVAQGCGLDIGFERAAAMAHISFDVIYSMLPYCDGVKWYSQMVAGARRHENRLAEAFMLLCMGQLMVYNGDCFEAQRHLKEALLIVKREYVEEEELYNCIKHIFGFSVALCDCNKISERECGLIKMTEALVMTRNIYGSNSLETALGRLHIGLAYKSLYEDTALRLEGLDYVERAHEVLEDKLGHHPYMGLCVQTLGHYHDTMLNINFSAEYNQAAKCYKLAYDIHKRALAGHRFTVRSLTQMGDFYHRMADYRQTLRYLEEAHSMATEHCPTDVVAAVAAFYLGLLYMDEECPEHDIYRGQNLFSSAANLLSKYGVTYQRATMLQQMSIASEEAGLKHTFFKQECDNIKSVMFGSSQHGLVAGVGRQVR